MKKGKIIILEGPDCSGKSTLANNLIKESNGIYIHNTYYKGMDVVYEHLHRFELAKQISNNGLNCFIDRMWLSELIYSKIYRDGVTNYNIDILADVFKNVDLNIICLPDKKKYLNLFEKNKEIRNEMFKENMNKIYDEYEKFLLKQSDFNNYYQGNYIKYDFINMSENELKEKISL